MHDLSTTQDKLLKTPSGDVHSPFYRKLVSAGYKGHLGGMFGGGALYGTLFSGVGALIAVPLLAFTPVGISALFLVPLMGAIGVWQGVHTFADIGTTAAIIAESAEIRERRQHLLDRYYETPSEDERKEISKLLDEQMAPKTPDKVFHWKTVMMGAIAGAFVAAGLIAAFYAFAHGVDIGELFGHVTKEVLSNMHLTGSGVGKEIVNGVTKEITITTLSGVGVAAFAALSAAIGGLIGLDREYVRRFLDRSEEVLNDPEVTKERRVAKVQEVERLIDAAQRGTSTIDVEQIAKPKAVPEPTSDKPDTKVTDISQHMLMAQQARAVGA